MEKTNFIKTYFKSFIKAAELTLNRLDEKFIEEGGEDTKNLLYYWQGKIDALKFASEVGDDFFYEMLIDYLKEQSYKESEIYTLEQLISERGVCDDYEEDEECIAS